MVAMMNFAVYIASYVCCIPSPFLATLLEHRILKLESGVGSQGLSTCLTHSFLAQVFEDDAIAWEERLNRINAIFDVWIDVQRRWVYLEGIFTGSADIKHLLPNETQRFQRYVVYQCPLKQAAKYTCNFANSFDCAAF